MYIYICFIKDFIKVGLTDIFVYVFNVTLYIYVSKTWQRVKCNYFHLRLCFLFTGDKYYFSNCRNTLSCHEVQNWVYWRFFLCITQIMYANHVLGLDDTLVGFMFLSPFVYLLLFSVVCSDANATSTHLLVFIFYLSHV